MTCNMRVISGKWKGRRLISPTGDLARPTTDRVKESMFDLLGPGELAGVVIDLFAGSGALGLESLSRGASVAHFVDVQAASVRTIRENLSALKVPATDGKVYTMDWRRALEQIYASAVPIAYVFVDPPYAKQLWEPVLQAVSSLSTPITCAAVCEHPTRSPLPDKVGWLTRKKNRAYGDIAISIYEDERATVAITSRGDV